MAKQRGRFNHAKFAAVLDAIEGKGMSRTEFAAKLGSSMTGLYHYAKGAREPGFSFVVRLAEVTKTKTDNWIAR